MKTQVFEASSDIKLMRLHERKLNHHPIFIGTACKIPQSIEARTQLMFLSRSQYSLSTVLDSACS